MMMEGITDGRANDFLQSVNFGSDDSDSDIEGAYSDGGSDAKRKKRKISTDILDRRSVIGTGLKLTSLIIFSFLKGKK